MINMLWRIWVSWFHPDERAPDRTLTGLLVSERSVAPVYDDDAAGAFRVMEETTSSDYNTSLSMHYRTRPAREATHYRLTKGETLTRECSVKVTA